MYGDVDIDVGDGRGECVDADLTGDSGIDRGDEYDELCFRDGVWE